MQSGGVLACDMAPPCKTKGKGGQANWTELMYKIFLEFCVEEMVAGNRPGHYFNDRGQKNIAAKFKRATSLDWTEPQFRNRWGRLKRDWTKWNGLLYSTTGAGWDPITKTISATDTWWQEKIAVLHHMLLHMFNWYNRFTCCIQ